MTLNILSLPLKKKIGQLFFIGLQGTEIEPENQRLLEEIKPGGVCLFSRNIRTAIQTRELNDAIIELLDVPPLISIDQEGGLVDRLRRIFRVMPAVSKLESVSEVRVLAQVTAETLKILGFNMNFAPVVDVIDEARSHFSNGLYSRTFGKEKQTVAEFTSIYLEELQNRGIIGCLKHFPGLGATEIDSHENLPTVNLTDAELLETDLYPYRELLKNPQTCAVMAAHAAFPHSNLQEYDQNGKLLPSSLSSNFITKLLRTNLGFNKMVLTDDLEMGAIVRNYGIGEACKMAFAAGEDMLTICADPQAVRDGFSALVEAFENGEYTEQRLDESLNRIAFVKSRISDSVDFSEAKLQALSGEIAELNKNLE